MPHVGVVSGNARQRPDIFRAIPRAHLLICCVLVSVLMFVCARKLHENPCEDSCGIARLPSSLLSTFPCPSPPWGKEYMNSPATSSILTYLAQPPPARGFMANKRNPGSHAEVHTDYTERRRFSPSF